MSRKPPARIATDASTQGLVGLSGMLTGLEGLPAAGSPTDRVDTPEIKHHGRVVMRKEKSGRGGKVVLVMDQFATHLTVPFLEKLLGRLQKACGCGGAIRGRSLELQGEQVDRVRKALEAEGFTVGGIAKMNTANDQVLIDQLRASGAASWRVRLAEWVESPRIQHVVTAVILANAVILGLETNRDLMARHGAILHFFDKLCLLVFVAELAAKFAAFRSGFWRSGWNWFDFFVVGIALVPGGGEWAVLRSLRVMRVLRLLTVVPALRKVVAAFLHAIPGLGGVMMAMSIFFYTAGVLATKLFGQAFPQWFGSLGASLYSLFQIMTLESWSMGIVRPVMEVYPYAWAFFVPFIIIATFTILNLFIGIIVPTMQELALAPEKPLVREEALAVLERVENDLKKLRQELLQARESKPGKEE